MTNLSRARRPDLVPGQERPPEYRYRLLRAALTAGRPGLATVDAVEMTALAQPSMS